MDKCHQWARLWVSIAISFCWLELFNLPINNYKIIFKWCVYILSLLGRVPGLSDQLYSGRRRWCRYCVVTMPWFISACSLSLYLKSLYPFNWLIHWNLCPVSCLSSISSSGELWLQFPPFHVLALEWFIIHLWGFQHKSFIFYPIFLLLVLGNLVQITEFAFTRKGTWMSDFNTEGQK